MVEFKFGSRDFNLKLYKFSEAVGEQSERMTKTISLSILKGVLEKTPVLTGVAKNSWQLALNEKPVPWISPVALGDGKVANPGASALGKASASLGTFKVGDSVHIYNYVPYILKLEDGSSKQHPAGMLKVTLDAIKFRLGASGA